MPESRGTNGVSKPAGAALLHYEQGGAPADIAGAPAVLVADTTWALAVAEAQVLTGDKPTG